MTVSADRGNSAAPLLDLYRIAIEEYRFNVQLGWDRTKFYVGLNTALAAVASTLLRIESDATLPFAAILLVGVVSSLFGIQTIWKGHEYYRKSIYKKTLIEDRLGLHEKLDSYHHELATLAVTSTGSQASTREIFFCTPSWLHRRIRLSTITGGLTCLMIVFILLYIGVLLWALLS